LLGLGSRAEGLEATPRVSGLAAASIVRGAAVVLIQAAVFVPVAFVRALDPDEGWYAYAAERTFHGQLPYRDFFFPQTPLLPYLYGAWFEVFGPSWYSGRGLSVLLTIATGTLVYRYCVQRFAPAVALAAVTAYTFSVFVVDWYLLVKTYAVSAFLLFAALLLVDRPGPPARRGAWFAAGLLLGLAVEGRLLLAVPALGFLLPLLRAREPRAWKLRSLAWGCAGAAVAALPAVFFLVRAPRPFLWDTLRYHAYRSPNGFIGNFHQKLQVADSLLSMPTGEGALNPQFLVLVIAAAASAALLVALRRPLPTALVVAALVGVASFLPTPSYTQYFSVTVPLLIVSAAEGLAAVADQAGRTDPQILKGLRLAAAISVLVYVALANVSLNGYAHWVRPSEIHRAERVTAWIDARTHPGEEVLTSWPGYLLGSHAVAVPGFENQYGPVTERAIGPGGATRYKLGSIDDVRRAIRTHRTRLVVWKNWVPKQRNPSWRRLLRHSAYRRDPKLRGVSAYVLAPRASSQSTSSR
jgi:4-amino-4-deoxy-L-arabinose transferase-like glycosyltransferase